MALTAQGHAHIYALDKILGVSLVTGTQCRITSIELEIKVSHALAFVSQVQGRCECLEIMTKIEAYVP